MTRTASAPERSGRGREILEVATRLFYEKGYHETTLADIAEVIGFTKPAIYYYYDSKEDLLFEIRDRIVRAALDRVREIIAAEEDPLRRLRAILRNHLGTLLANAEANIVFHEERGVLSEEREESIRQHERRYDRLIREVYAAGVAEGRFRDVDPTIAVGMLLGACNWTYRWFREGGAVSEDDVTDSILGLLSQGYETA